MKLSEFIDECKQYLDKYGDLNIGMISEYPNLDTPMICHSEDDYKNNPDNADDNSWKSIGYENIFIIDSYERNIPKDN